MVSIDTKEKGLGAAGITESECRPNSCAKPSNHSVPAQDPVQNVKRVAAQKKADELGVELESEKESTKKDNQIILSGTAYYDFNHFATYWKKWKSIIQSGGDQKKLREVF